MLDGFVEVGLGGGRNPVGAAPEVDDVQIGLQHIVFRPLPRHLGGDDQFLGLTHQAADPVLGRTHQRVLHVLLGDRRPALQVAAAEEVVVHRAHETAEIEPRVRVEVAVFGGDHRLAHMHGNLIDVDVDPIAFRRNDLGDLRAVAGQDGRNLVGAKVTRLGNVDDEVRHRERDDRQQHQHRGAEVGPSSHPQPVDLLGPGPVAPRWDGPPAGAAGSSRAAGTRGRRRRPAGRTTAEAGALVPAGRRPPAVQCGLDFIEGVAPQRRRRRAGQRGFDFVDGIASAGPHGHP